MAIFNILKMMVQYSMLGIICLGSEKTFSTVKPLTVKQLVTYSTLMRCVIDSLCHGLIALYSWLLSIDFEYTLQNVSNAIVCAVIACCVDVDHFIAAGSWKLKDALRLKSRPPLHSTSILLPHVLIVLHAIISRKSTGEGKRRMEWTLLSFTAIMTHHLRDAYRRGLWFWPIGSTPPLPTAVYIVSTFSVPFVVSQIRRYFYSMRKSAIVDLV